MKTSHNAVAEVAEVTVRGTAAPRPRNTFYTRSISDPGLIPLLIASGVSFTALQVGFCFLSIIFQGALWRQTVAA